MHKRFCQPTASGLLYSQLSVSILFIVALDIALQVCCSQPHKRVTTLIVMQLGCAKVAFDRAPNRPLLRKIAHQTERQLSSSGPLKHNCCAGAPRLQVATYRVQPSSVRKSLRMRKPFDFANVKWCTLTCEMHKHLFGRCTCQDTGGTKHLFGSNALLTSWNLGAALTEPLKLILLTFYR